MVERLSVTADQIEFAAVTSSGGRDGVCIKVAKQRVQSSQIRDPGGTRIHSRKNRLPNRARIGEVFVRECAKPQVATPTAHGHDGYVDPIHRGTTHHAGDDHRSRAAFFWTSSRN